MVKWNTLFLWRRIIESIAEILSHGINLPSLEDFVDIILFAETSEEIPSNKYVSQIFKTLGERGIHERVRGVMIGKPKSWEFDKQNNAQQKIEHKKRQRETILQVLRQYSKNIPIIQNIDFGHTDPQICLPNGQRVTIDIVKKIISIKF